MHIVFLHEFNWEFSRFTAGSSCMPVSFESYSCKFHYINMPLECEEYDVHSGISLSSSSSSSAREKLG